MNPQIILDVGTRWSDILYVPVWGYGLYATEMFMS
jgi:hypothetical protein